MASRDLLADKVVEAILTLLETAQGLGKPVSQFDILSTLFLADRRHLLSRGRPITGDAYVAMEGGPVGSIAYDLLKHGVTPSGEPVPWVAFEQRGRRAVFFGEPQRVSRSDLFDPREATTLVDVLRTVKEMGYGDTLALTKADPTYRSARRRDSGRAPAIDLSGDDGRAEIDCGRRVLP